MDSPFSANNRDGATHDSEDDPSLQHSGYESSDSDSAGSTDPEGHKSSDGQQDTGTRIAFPCLKKAKSFWRPSLLQG